MTDDVGVNHPEYDNHVEKWEFVDNICESEDVDQYLIPQYVNDNSPENAQRNKDYRARASWLGVSGFTLAGLIGTAYAKPPTITLPIRLEYMRGNVDGSSVGLVQQMQSTTREVLKAGRVGLFVTYPDTAGAPVSLADVEAARFVPTIHKIDAERIVNWADQRVGAEVILTMVVFTDRVVTRGQFARSITNTRRELSLTGDGGRFVLVDRVWAKDEKTGDWEIISETMPRQGNGQPWSRIPFTFVGAVDNNSKIDKSPMMDIATKNRDYYRNSADFEESVYYAGQAQPWATGVDADALNDMREAGIHIGGKNMIVFPNEASSFGYATAPSNPMVRQAMLDKLEEMAAIGARLIKPGTVAKTATQAIGESAVSHSILSLAVENVATAYRVALEWAADYQNANAADISVEPDKSYMTAPINAQDITAFGGLIAQGTIGPADAHRYLTKHAIIAPEKPLADYLDELASRPNMFTAGV